jgi:hypothetical protein
VHIANTRLLHLLPALQVRDLHLASPRLQEKSAAPSESTAGQALLHQHDAGSSSELKTQETQHKQHAAAPKHAAGQPFEKRSLILSPAEIYAEIVHHGEMG